MNKHTLASLVVVVSLAVSCFFISLVHLSSDTSGDIIGTVTDNYGSSIANARIELIGQTLFNYTNINGTYIISDISVGSYTLKASKMGYYEVQKSVEVFANMKITKDITLSANTGTGTLNDMINSILSYGWLSIGIGGLVGFLVVILAVTKLTGWISRIIMEGFLCIVAWLPALIAQLTYGTSLGIHPMGLILFPFIWDSLLGLYAGVNSQVVQMSLVMLFISYLAMLQLSYIMVKYKKLPIWYVFPIGFVALLGFGLGLPNFWNFAITNFLMPLIAIASILIFAFAIMLFIKVKQTKKGITLKSTI